MLLFTFTNSELQLQSTIFGRKFERGTYYAMFLNQLYEGMKTYDDYPHLIFKDGITKAKYGD